MIVYETIVYGLENNSCGQLDGEQIVSKAVAQQEDGSMKWATMYLA